MASRRTLAKYTRAAAERSAKYTRAAGVIKTSHPGMVFVGGSRVHTIIAFRCAKDADAGVRLAKDAVTTASIKTSHPGTACLAGYSLHAIAILTNTSHAAPERSLKSFT
jgi:hypothetical protein